jgi:hypothetical protein
MSKASSQKTYIYILTRLINGVHWHYCFTVMCLNIYETQILHMFCAQH